METFELKVIAEKNGLEYIETTTAINGYPQSIKEAVIGFETFQQAADFATENDLEVQFFETENGWDFWYRNGNSAFKEMTVSASDYGDDYGEIYKGEFLNQEDFLEEEVVESLSIDECSSFQEIEAFLKVKKKLWEEAEKMEEDEVIITCCGEFYETMKKETMQFSFDMHTYVIGCI